MADPTTGATATPRSRSKDRHYTIVIRPKDRPDTVNEGRCASVAQAIPSGMSPRS